MQLAFKVVKKYNISMRRIRALLFFGIWVAILPYLGFPYSWKNFLFTVSGIALVFFACILYKEHKTTKNVKETFDNFSENSDFNTNTSMNETNN